MPLPIKISSLESVIFNGLIEGFQWPLVKCEYQAYTRRIHGALKSVGAKMGAIRGRTFLNGKNEQYDAV